MRATRCRTPRGGIYYLVPTREEPGGWEVHALRAEAERCADLAHKDFWNDVVDMFLKREFSLTAAAVSELAGATYGLPRGRVVPPGTHGHGAGIWLILHGADEPDQFLKGQILKVFRLQDAYRKGKVRWLLDEHEQTQPWDVKTVDRIVGMSREPGGRP